MGQQQIFLFSCFFFFLSGVLCYHSYPILRPISYNFSPIRRPFSSHSSTLSASRLLDSTIATTTTDRELLEFIETLPQSFQLRDIQGCWQVKRTLLEPQWKKYSNIFGVLGNIRFRLKAFLDNIENISKEEKNSNVAITTTALSNRNFQIFKDDKFINLSEYWGSSFYATAAGSYQVVQKEKKSNFIPQAWNNNDKKPPLQLTARVSRVDIHLRGFQFKLNIQGDGIVNALYCKNNLRIFRNEDGAIAIQEFCPDGIPVEYASLFDLYFQEQKQ